MLRIGKRREEYFAAAQAALLEAKHRKSIGKLLMTRVASTRWGVIAASTDENLP
jgi:hypothetical protein